MFNTRSYLHVVSMTTLFFVACDANAAEWSIESDVDSRVEYHDNIFLTTLDHDSVTGLIVTPSLKLLARDQNWETSLDTRLRSNNYDDSNLNSNDIYFDLTERYATERNSYSLNGNLDFDSNLDSESTDFGILGTRIKRERLSITPQFTRQITERLMFSTNYTYLDVDYKDAENTGFVAYETNSVSGSLVYNFSEKDQVNFVVQAVNYESKDNTFEYDLITARIGVSRQWSESFSTNYLVGGSQRDSTSRRTQTFDFFGQPVTITQVTDTSDSGFVMDAGFDKKWLTSSLTGSVSRDNTSDSFGGLNEVDRFKLVFGQKITEIWKYSVSASYDSTRSIGGANQFADREYIFLEPVVYYSLARDLRVNASYRYVRRKFSSQVGSDTPDSNRFFVGITYNFPSISTF